MWRKSQKKTMLFVVHNMYYVLLLNRPWKQGLFFCKENKSGKIECAKK